MTRFRWTVTPNLFGFLIVSSKSEVEVRMKNPIAGITILALLGFMLCSVGSAMPRGQKLQKEDKNCCGDASLKDGDAVVAVINGSRIIREKEIDEALGSQLYNLQERVYNLRKKALDNLITRILLKEEAGKRNMSEEDLRAQLMPAQVDVKKADIDKAYTEMLSTLENMSEEEAKLRIKLDLEGRLRLDRYKAAVSELMNSADIQTYLVPPVATAARINAEGPSLGSKQAPVTVVEFSDFQCPYCKQASGMVKRLLETYGDSIRLVFKQMPLSIHPDAFKAAQASICANQQGRFWDFHDVLFGANDLSVPALKKYAVSLGMRMNEFESCLESEASSASVRSDIQEAVRADVQGTPTFFVNGRILRGMRTAEDLKNLIDLALRQK
jgi:protein-disulfide isomerase